jgi:hypothetical protein
MRQHDQDHRDAGPCEEKTCDNCVRVFQSGPVFENFRKVRKSAGK